eukprot:2629599-Amphidinium_carterae.1
MESAQDKKNSTQDRGSIDLVADNAWQIHPICNDSALSSPNEVGQHRVFVGDVADVGRSHCSKF